MPRPQPIAGVLRMRGTSQRELSRESGYSETWISQVVRGRVSPSPRFRRVIAACLDLPPEALFREDQRARGAA
jgi:lambda repressor-like predicted transcriptional regulator